MAGPPTEKCDVVVVPVAPVVALAERQLLSGGQAFDGSICDASGGEGVAGIAKVSAPKAGLNGAAILGEPKRMQVDSPATAVLKLDPYRKPVLPWQKAEGGQKAQGSVRLIRHRWRGQGRDGAVFDVRARRRPPRPATQARTPMVEMWPSRLATSLASMSQP